jgi:hypothetical protein
VTPQEARAQDPSLLASRLNTAAFSRFADPDDVVMAVSVWGDVRFPGYYEVPRGTTLSALLSMAGGPANARRTNRQRIRTVIALHRPAESSSQVREPVYTISAVNAVPDVDQQLVMFEGDILSVETVTRTAFSWRDVFPIVGAIGTAALAIERISSSN